MNTPRSPSAELWDYPLGGGRPENRRPPPCRAVFTRVYRRAFLLAMLLIAGGGSGWALRVEPSRIEFKSPPGKSGSAAFDVTNDTNEPLTIQPSAKDWFVLKENKKLSAKDWIDLNTKPFRLKPGESRHVTFKVKAPPEAREKLVGMMSFLALKDTPQMVNLVVSCGVYMEIEGTEVVSGEISKLAVRSTPDGRLQGTVVVHNKGNVHLRLDGWMEVMDRKGNQVARIFLELGRPVYPGMERSYTGYSVPVDLSPGTYKLIAHMKWGDQETVKENRLRVTEKGEYKLE